MRDRIIDFYWVLPFVLISSQIGILGGLSLNWRNWLIRLFGFCVLLIIPGWLRYLGADWYDLDSAHCSYLLTDCDIWDVWGYYQRIKMFGFDLKFCFLAFFSIVHLLWFEEWYLVSSRSTIPWALRDQHVGYTLQTPCHQLVAHKQWYWIGDALGSSWCPWTLQYCHTSCRILSCCSSLGLNLLLIPFALGNGMHASSAALSMVGFPFLPGYSSLFCHPHLKQLQPAIKSKTRLKSVRRVTASSVEPPQEYSSRTTLHYIIYAHLVVIIFH